MRCFLHALAALALSFALPVLADGPDELWEVTAKMGSMPGMPAGHSMPAQVHTVCVPPGKIDQAAAGDPKDCKISDLKAAGTRTSFRVECTGKHPVSGAVDIDHPTPASYQGTMKMNTQGMNMTVNFSGRKLGSCTYQGPAIK